MLSIEFPTLAHLREIVRDELIQRREEGCQVGDWPAAADAAADDRARLLDIHAALSRLTPRADWPYDEPSELAAIRAARPAGPDITAPATIDAGLADRIHGGWLGRCAGLVLGKPAEHGPFMRSGRKLREYLVAAGAYPLNDWIPGSAAACEAVGIGPLPFPASQRGNVRMVESDDDIRYTIAGLEVLEERGAAFTTGDVARWWTHRLPPAMLFTAEEAALRNLMLLRGHFQPQQLSADDLARVATWMNPYREWIGAQIRADGWALACPGQPERAAEFAWRDAALSHVKNGIYGEMFCAAMIAAAAVLDDPAAIVAAGLAQIPERSRLAEAVRDTVEYCRTHDPAPAGDETALEWLWETFGQYHPVHTINNAAAVVHALLRGGEDFERVITLAVLAGWDTDCNGATAGCICGTMLGAARLPEKWTAPLNDTLMSEIPGFHPIAISTCARRQVEVARRLLGG
jgi:ADP-ribosylglycohydrolase